MPPHQHKSPYPRSISGTVLLILIPIFFFQFVFGLGAKWYGYEDGSGLKVARCESCAREAKLSVRGTGSRMVDFEASRSRRVGSDIIIRRDDDVDVHVVLEGDDGTWAEADAPREERLLNVIKKFCAQVNCNVQWLGGAFPAELMERMALEASVSDTLATSDENVKETAFTGAKDGNSRDHYEMEFVSGKLAGITVVLRP